MTQYDFADLFYALAQSSHTDRINTLLTKVGVPYWCDHIVAGSVAHLVSIGPVFAHDPNFSEAVNQSRVLMGLVGGMSYLRHREKLYNKIVKEHGHMSCGHGISVTILLAGISCSVENEFNSQRDIIHMGRITKTRTHIQNAPPYVCLNKKFVPLFQDQRKHTLSLYNTMHTENLSERECMNLLHPKASATAVLITGTLRNFQKLLQGLKDTHKEDEFLMALHHIQSCLCAYWPEFYSAGQEPC